MANVYFLSLTSEERQEMANELHAWLKEETTVDQMIQKLEDMFTLVNVNANRLRF